MKKFIISLLMPFLVQGLLNNAFASKVSDVGAMECAYVSSSGHITKDITGTKISSYVDSGLSFQLSYKKSYTDVRENLNGNLYNWPSNSLISTDDDPITIGNGSELFTCGIINNDSGSSPHYDYKIYAGGHEILHIRVMDGTMTPTWKGHDYGYHKHQSSGGKITICDDANKKKC